MHTIMPALRYAKIRSYIEHCMLHIYDFYIYYKLFHSLFPSMHQLKETIANFIIICQTSDCMHQSKHNNMHMCVHAYTEKKDIVHITKNI